MAPDAEKKRGRPPGSTKKKEGDKDVRLTLSRRQYEYVCWLAENTKLGASPELIVAKLIADKLEEMDPSDFQQPK